MRFLDRETGAHARKIAGFYSQDDVEWRIAARQLRVLTRFVLKYTLRARPEPSGAHEAVEGGTGHAGDLGDGGLGNAQFEEAPDIVLLAIEP